MKFPHYIYVVALPTGLIKIGCSRTPQDRFRQLSKRYSLFGKLRLLGMIGIARDAFRVENTVHKLLDHKRCFGEWFDVSETEAITAIRRAKRQQH